MPNRPHVMILLVAAVAWVSGCAGVRPEPGKAAAVLDVQAEPKQGAPDGSIETPNDYGVAAAAGEPARIDYTNLTNIIVWLTPAAAVPTGPVSLDVPATDDAVQPTSIGQRVDIRNAGSRPMSFYSLSDGNDFDLKTLAPGATGSFVVRAEGLIEVLSDGVDAPVALLYAVPSPYVARAVSREKVVFNNMPPGRYTAHTWHPRIPGSTTEVLLEADRVTPASIRVSVNVMARRR